MKVRKKFVSCRLCVFRCVACFALKSVEGAFDSVLITISNDDDIIHLTHSQGYALNCTNELSLTSNRNESTQTRGWLSLTLSLSLPISCITHAHMMKPLNCIIPSTLSQLCVSTISNNCNTTYKQLYITVNVLQVYNV